MNVAKVKIQLPQAALEVMQRVFDSGHEIYAVGGFVRDFFIGKNGGDVDFTTDLLPCEIKTLFFDCKVIETGIKHGTVTVIYMGVPFEITTYRSDGEYLDSRHPQSVCFESTLENDLARRDFTMNAICCFSYKDDYGVIDLFGGIEDIKNGIIRAIGNPHKRFVEDALRILRGYRFAAQLGFSFDECTREAAVKASPLLKRISLERKLFELFAILSCQKSKLLYEMYQDGILEDIFGGRISLSPVDISNVLNTKNPTLRMAMLISRLDNVTYFSLPLDKQIKGIVSLIKNEGTTKLEKDKSVLKKRLFLIGREQVFLLLDYQNAIGIIDDFDGIAELLDRIFANDECFSIKQLKINGDDLKNCFPDIRGEQVGALLKKLLILVIDERLENKRDMLLAYLKNKMD